MFAFLLFSLTASSLDSSTHAEGTRQPLQELSSKSGPGTDLSPLTGTELGSWTFGASHHRMGQKKQLHSHQNVSVVTGWPKVRVNFPRSVSAQSSSAISGSCKCPAPLKGSSLIPCSRSCNLPPGKPKNKIHISPFST